MALCMVVLVLVSLPLQLMSFGAAQQHEAIGEPGQSWNPRTTLCDRYERALGLESGALDDGKLSASSSYNEQSVGPQLARLNHDNAGGAWCPSPQLDSKVSGSEWLQINLTERHVITGVSTQGRFGNGLGVEYVEEFWIEYSRDQGKTWHKWKNRRGSHLLEGNTDTYTVRHNQLELPIVGAQLIRLVPYSAHMRTVCMRAELFGCPYDGPTLYQMPDGFFGGRFGDLIDDSYDGVRDKNAYLGNGLGQLLDGIRGTENYKLNAGFEWIGWKANNETIEIQFTFPRLRNFTSASFHCHNLFRKSVEVFGSAKVYFSFDGSRWSKSPVDFDYMPDHIIESPREVVVHLNHRVARHVRFSLKFAAKWMLISEISFNSEPVTGDYVENIDDLESLEVAQEPIGSGGAAGGPTVFQGSNTSLAFVFIFLGVVLTCLAIIVAIAGLVYQFYQRRQKKGGNGFYNVDVDFAIHHSPSDLHQGFGGGVGPRSTNDFISIGGVVGGGNAMPLYCEPDNLDGWRSPASGGCAQTQHEYAVPDVLYQQSGGGKVLNSTATHQQQHRSLISNPLQDDGAASDSDGELNDSSHKFSKSDRDSGLSSENRTYQRSSATSPSSGGSNERESKQPLLGSPGNTMAILTRNNLFASARGLLLNGPDTRSDTDSSSCDIAAAKTRSKLYPSPYIGRSGNDYSPVSSAPPLHVLEDFVSLARSPGRFHPPPPTNTPASTADLGAGRFRDSSLGRVADQQQLRSAAPTVASIKQNGTRTAGRPTRTSRSGRPRQFPQDPYAHRDCSD